jgi:PAS domain S-box-containing protein
MQAGPSLLPFLRDLAIAPDRPEAIGALERRLGVSLAVCLIFDPEVNTWLAARGFAQTFPAARRWQAFVAACAEHATHQGLLPWPEQGAELPALVVKAQPGGAMIFLGAFPSDVDLAEIREFLPILTAVFLAERTHADAAMQLDQAGKIAREARTLALCLDEARRSAQLEVAARRETEVQLERARDELAEAQSRLAATLSATEIATWTWDITRDRVLADPNMALMFGLDPADAAGGPIANYLRAIHPDDMPRVEQAIAAALSSGRYEIDYRLLRGQPAIRWVTARGKVEWNEAGQPARFSGVIIDITDRKTVEEALATAKLELEQNNQTLEKAVVQRTAKLSETVAELEAFSHSIAHDMRSPLRAMRGFSEILLKEYAPDLGTDACGLLQRIANAAERMDQLIRDVLNYSQVVRSDSTLDRIELEPLLRELVETYPMFAPDQAEISLLNSLPAVRGNAAMLSQIFSNLIGNAVKFVSPGHKPKIFISSECDAEWVRIFVQDFGIGIPADQHEKIFGIFQRVELSYPGTGIGLAVVKKAAERMRGKVGLTSEVGRGTTFWLQLQRADGGVEQAASASFSAS